ncbi:MAG: WYL domain-containing protein [Deltaproteobacteria bacterium]|nr:WYL domain-containing protein [Deltaproteobacteria bacterium]
MSDQLAYERFYWFNDEIKSGRYPNTTGLVEEFGISRRTAHRDIDFMRVRLNAPLEFVRFRNGYQYTNDAYELPGRWISEANVFSLALAVRLASTIPDPAIKNDLCAIINKALGRSGKRGNNCLETFHDKISVKNIEYSRVNTWCFRETVQALFADSPLRITYHSPHIGRNSTRTVQPLHLMHYMGNWHLIAWCTASRALRDFALARIKNVTPSDDSLKLPDNLPPMKEYTRKYFGIMQGDAGCEVVLCFSPQSAPWVVEQVWHPEQQTSPEPDGGLLLYFPAADFRELVKRILSHGAGVKIISPPELRDLARREIRKMAEMYEK